ncbi:hypothetical protein BDF22DRAFT_744411 [Syncephalis plumigaleata]|nr:hypothetical protein BDF22DRAFT_744411 [Syncephalis plumigaleata]
MYHQLGKVSRSVQHKHLWHLVQRVIACHGPMNSKELYEIVQKSTSEDIRSAHYFKQRVLLEMKEHGLITIKSNNYIISQASRQIIREKQELLNQRSKEEKIQIALQALRGINVAKANPPSKKQRRVERAKLDLPEPKYAWHLNANPEQIQKWKEAGLPADSDLKELLAKHGNALFAIEKATVIPSHQQENEEKPQL